MLLSCSFLWPFLLFNQVCIPNHHHHTTLPMGKDSSLPRRQNLGHRSWQIMPSSRPAPGPSALHRSPASIKNWGCWSLRAGRPIPQPSSATAASPVARFALPPLSLSLLPPSPCFSLQPRTSYLGSSINRGFHSNQFRLCGLLPLMRWNKRRQEGSALLRNLLRGGGRFEGTQAAKSLKKDDTRTVNQGHLKN